MDERQEMAALKDAVSSRRAPVNPVKKVARDDRADPHATEALQRFLREESPPEDLFKNSVKRGRYGREFFRSLLRTRSTSTPAILRDHILNGGNVPHNCVILRQEVPGKRTEYYRIVRDSSQFDSLETRSTFQVNYEFPRHDVGDGGGINRKTKTASRKGPDSELSISKGKARFHIHPRFLTHNSSKARPSGTERANLPTTTEESEHSIRGIPSPQQHQKFHSINRSMVSARTNTWNHDSEEPGAYIPCRLETAPQIQDFVPTASFPASDLINSWGKRGSRKSPMTSPNKVKGLPSLLTSAQRPITGPLPRAKLHKHKYDISSNNQCVSTTQPSARPPRRLASPVKLNRGQQISSRAVPRFKINSKNDREAPLALRSNPSRSNEELLLQPSETCQAMPKSPPAKSSARVVGTSWKSSGNSSSHGMESFGNAMDTPLSMNRVRHDSKEISPPLTPAPTLPLPPLPNVSWSKGIEVETTMRETQSPVRFQNTISVSDQPFPSRSAAMMTPQKSPQAQQNLAGQVSSETNVNNKPIDNVSGNQSHVPKVADHVALNTSDVTSFSKIDWPQPPSSQPDSGDQQVIDRSRSSWELSEDDPFLNRKQKTASLKRKHLQRARRQSESFQHETPLSSISNAGSQSVIELPSTRSSQPEYLDIVFGQSAGGSEYTESLLSRSVSKAVPKLTFTGVKTEAEIRPLVSSRVHDHRSASGRTIYRSHSTQMSPIKGRVLSDPPDHALANNISKEQSYRPRDLPTQYQALPLSEHGKSIATGNSALNYDKGVKHETNETNKLLNGIEKLMMDMKYELKAEFQEVMAREVSAIQVRMNLLETTMMIHYEVQEREQ